MKLQLILGGILFGVVNRLNEVVAEPCPQWTTGRDRHGVYTCPPYTTEESLWGLMKCAYQQTNNFTIPTAAQKLYTKNLVAAIVDRQPTKMVGLAKKLHLNFCRVRKRDTHGKVIDSILVGVAAPGYNYNGAFFLVRESNAWPILMEIPHDDFANEPPMRAFENGRAYALIKNGQRRINGPNAKCSNRPPSDAAHSVYHGFYDAHVAFVKARPSLIVLHLHGTGRGGLLITNGFSESPGSHSLLFAATKLIAGLAPNRTDVRTCAEGTHLPQQTNCGINQAWVEVRQLTCSPGPQCKLGTRNLNRVLGFETNGRYIAPSFLVTFMRGLADGYLKTRDHTPQTCTLQPS